MKAENVHYIDNDTRVCLKFSFNALGRVLALQRKRKNKWETVSWIYPIVVAKESPDTIIDYLLWAEKKKTKYSLFKRGVGNMLMSEIKAAL